ncbi:hypothetical protein [Acidiphilium sp. PM]|uniref:hypothetical protein n=1 Tax=Acidiphilium sp. PM TaxID=1043206 RepID=UPI001301476F|nr:hypothetical protein [Acidiphilium sp. PM]
MINPAESQTECKSMSEFGHDEKRIYLAAVEYLRQAAALMVSINQLKDSLIIDNLANIIENRPNITKKSVSLSGRRIHKKS